MRLTCDFEANNNGPAKLTTAIYRGGRNALLKKSPTLAFWKAADLLWTRIVVGAEIPFTADVGVGLRLPHWGRGLIIAPGVTVGDNATLYHRVTLGLGEDKKVPTLGNGVYVGTGATILGGCTLADGTKVGANAIVTKSTTAASIVVGANQILAPRKI